MIQTPFGSTTSVEIPASPRLLVKARGNAPRPRGDSYCICRKPYRPDPVAPDPALGTGEPLGCVLGDVRLAAPVPAAVMLGCVAGVTSDPRVPPLASLEPLVMV